MSSNHKILVTGDWHIPEIDNIAFNKLLNFAKKETPTEIILNGDILDCGSMSSFTRYPDTPSVMDEVSLAKRYLKRLRNVVDCPIAFLGGNHCWRLSRQVLDKMPGLYGAVKLEKLLGLDDMEISYKPNGGTDNFVKRGDYLIGHFLTLRQDAGASAIALMKRYGTSIVTGHGHRLAVVSMRLYGRTLYGAESGCICSLEPRYQPMSNWNGGFVLIEDGLPRPIFI